jgi:hypothetical protein
MWAFLREVPGCRISVSAPLDRIEAEHAEGNMHAKLAVLSPKTVTNH